jgi:hypothetical protein
MGRKMANASERGPRGRRRPSTVYKWVSAGLAAITQETAEKLHRVMMEQYHQIIQKLMPLIDETALKNILDGILKVQQQQMKLAGLLRGSGGISLSFGKGDGSGDSDEDVVVRIKADAPVLSPDELVPARPVLQVRPGSFLASSEKAPGGSGAFPKPGYQGGASTVF